MENKVLEKNLDRIKQYDKKLADNILMTENLKSKLSLCQTNLGEYNILIDDVPVHSQEGAIEESKKIVSLIDNKQSENIIRIIYGLGLGYLADEVANSVKGKIVIYEPNIDILKFVFSVAQIDALFKDNVFICNNKNAFSKIISSCAKSDTRMMLSALPYHKTNFKDDMNELIKIAQRARGEVKAGENTYILNAPKAIKNTFLNLKYLFKNVCISDLKDIYKGKTAICLSAGPSLRNNIEIIKENREKFVIFAVSPTLKLLKEYDILPDYIVVIEANDVDYQLKNVDCEKCCLITEGFSSNFVVKTKTKKTINYISNENFLNFWIRECLGLKDKLATRGTVSYTAFMSAYVMGFDKIILCGQDLAYSDGNCYAKGSQFEDLECVYDEDSKKYVIRAADFDKYVNSFMGGSIDKNSAISSANYNIKFLNNNIYTVKSQDGKDIPTQTGYALFIDWFSRAAEQLKEEKPNIKLINSSTGGAQIDGFENLPLQEAIKDDKAQEVIDIEKVKHLYDKQNALNKINLMYDNLLNFKNMLEDLSVSNKKALKEIQNKKVLTPNILKLLQKNDDCLSKVLKEKDNPQIRAVIIIFINEYVKVIDKDYMGNADLCAKVLKKIMHTTDYIALNVKLFLDELANCKSLVS